MPITHSPQDWTPGKFVNVGFLKLRILEVIPTPKDHKPDAYILTDPRKGKVYKFTPHFGLELLSPQQDPARRD